ncbi:hypothetical protein C1T17_04245 [Sphingobium sp. SCG-1]|uniref:hypothetical protein n=1 Tax=Sphingobium sp. SCG-1 TaxID=2072936 RepID=UPI000CD67E74|nr:hypothetical protein [Sphingobium sp. SCG-1]AUW57429.1 hypothetical protein C1T17_04245 [Sphingobium sp. SCG-1]
MNHSVRLDNGEHAQLIDNEIERIRECLGRSSKLRDLFDYLVDRSRTGTPPREVEISQDVFGRTTQAGDDGGARVYIHRLRKRLEEIYGDRRGAGLRLTLPLGEYRLIAEIGSADFPGPESAPLLLAPRRQFSWRALAIAAVGLTAAFALVVSLLLWPAPGVREATQVRQSEIWKPLFANRKSVIIAEGDHYLFGEKGAGGEVSRLVRDYRIHSREDLDAYLLSHSSDAARYIDVGQSYIPTTVPRAQQYLAPILARAPSVRVLPATQVPAAAMLSQNIIYLGLSSGLGPLSAPTTSGSRFELSTDSDQIRDKRTGRVYGAGPSGGASPRRQYGLVSLFFGKEGNRYIILAGTSEMGLVGLVETIGAYDGLRELSNALHSSGTAEALYEVDSQGAGVLAVRLVATNQRDQQRVWTP